MSRVTDTTKYKNFVSWDNRYVGKFDQDEAAVYNYFYHNVFRNKDNGFIIDIGANDGVTISHSLPFIDKGWSALMIEPNPFLFEKMNDLYSHLDDVVCVNLAVDNKKQDNIKLYLGSSQHQGHSTILKSETEWPGVGQYFSDNTVIVKADTLDNILNQNNLHQHIDILHIDAEGKTLDIIKHFDLDKHKPSYLSLDILTQDFDPRGPELKKIMQEKKYKLIFSKGQSVWERM